MKKVLEWISKRESIEKPPAEEKRMFVKIFNIKENEDIVEALEFLKLGTTIVLLKIKNPSVIFKAMKQVKDLCAEIDGSVLGLSAGMFMALPANVKVVKKAPEDHFVEKVVEDSKEETQEEKPKIIEEKDDEWVDIIIDPPKEPGSD